MNKEKINNSQSTLCEDYPKDKDCRVYGKYKVITKFVGTQDLTDAILDYAEKASSIKYDY